VLRKSLLRHQAPDPGLRAQRPPAGLARLDCEEIPPTLARDAPRRPLRRLGRIRVVGTGGPCLLLPVSL